MRRQTQNGQPEPETKEPITKTLSDRSDLVSDGISALEISGCRRGDNWPKPKCAHRAFLVNLTATLPNFRMPVNRPVRRVRQNLNE